MVALVVAATLPGQGQGPGGVRVDRQDPVHFQEAVKDMEGKLVRSLQIFRRGAKQGDAALLVDPAAAESYVRSLQTRVGQPFEARRVANDCNSLWDERRMVVQGFAAEIDGQIAVQFVIEVEVEVYDEVVFEGNRHLDKTTIDGLLGITADRQVTRTEAEAMRKVLIARYRRDGYAFCGVTLTDLPADELGVAALPGSRPLRRLRFAVDEGPEVTLGKVRFFGNASYPADPVFGLFGTGNYLLRDAGLSLDPRRGFVAGSAWSRETLEEDLDRLRLFYRARGFLDATVDLTEARVSPDRSTVDLDFLIVEGPRYRVRSVRVEHVRDLNREPLVGQPRHPAAEIEQELQVAAGDEYDHDRLMRDVQRIQDYYGRRGHPPQSFPGMSDVPGGCRVFEPLEVLGSGSEVDIVYQVLEGVPKTLHDVVIRGNRFTRDAVIRRRVRVLPGDPIDMVEVRQAQRAIEQTRYFQDPASGRGPRLQLEPVPGREDQVDVGIDLEDGATGDLRWGVGISTGQGAQGNVTFNKRNFDLWKPPSSANPITAVGEILDNQAFHGGGQQLSMLLAPGTRFSQFQLTWIEPDVFRDHFETYELRVNGRRLIQRLPDGYTSDLLGAEVQLSRNFTRWFNAGVAVRHETVQVESLAPDATSLAFDAEGSTELRGTRLSLRYRDFDDPMRPTSGLELGLSADYVGGFLGGGESLTRYVHNAHLYVPIAENEMGHRTVLHLEHMLGFAEAFGGSDDVFVTQRFYMGGASLRGFGFRRAGPTQFGRPIGGEAMYTATAEVTFPLIATRMEGDVRDRELVRVVTFSDFGLLGLSADDPTFREPRLSVGFGVRIQVPFLELPIALDLGWPLIYEETDDRRQLYFSISP